MLVVEDAERARERGARVYGEIAGYAATFDPRPGSGRAPGAAHGHRARPGRRRASAPDDVDVVFADAAGVPELDRAEAEAIAEVFGAARRAGHRAEDDDRPALLRRGAAGRGRRAAGHPRRRHPADRQRRPPAADYGLDLVTERAAPAAVRTALVLARGHGGFNSALVVRAAARPPPGLRTDVRPTKGPTMTAHAFTLDDLRAHPAARAPAPTRTSTSTATSSTPRSTTLGYESLALLETGSRIEREYGIAASTRTRPVAERRAHPADADRRRQQPLLATPPPTVQPDPTNAATRTMTQRHAQRVALVTGATSGIGLAVARLLGRAGAPGLHRRARRRERRRHRQGAAGRRARRRRRRPATYAIRGVGRGLRPGRGRPVRHGRRPGEQRRPQRRRRHRRHRRRAVARRHRHQPQQRLPDDPRGAHHRRHARQGPRPDHQHRLHRRQAGRRARRAVLGLQARRRRLHQGARQRARPDRHHRQRRLPRLRRDADGPAGARRATPPRTTPPRTPSSRSSRPRSRSAATPRRRRSPAWSATWPPTPPPPSPRRRSTSAAASATSDPHPSDRGIRAEERRPMTSPRGRARDHRRRARPPPSTGCSPRSSNWPRIFPPTIHVDQVERDGTQERIRIWATANGEPKNWTSRRTLDPDGAAHHLPPGGLRARRSPRWAAPGSSSRCRRAAVPGPAAARLPGGRRRPATAWPGSTRRWTATAAPSWPR